MRTKLAPIPLAAALLVAGCWMFPELWYTQEASSAGSDVWISAVTNAPAWRCEPMEVTDSAESVLAADDLFSAEFFRTGNPSPDAASHSTSASLDSPPIRLFVARRFEEDPHEIGLFVHTPDRCWTETGWALEKASPSVIELPWASRTLTIERRVFSPPAGSPPELVYFFGLIGGMSVPYRLDHNLSVGLRLREADNRRSGSVLRATDPVFWKRVWESFRTRSRLFGPKQFVRMSTPIHDGDVAGADRRLTQAFHELLE